MRFADARCTQLPLLAHGASTIAASLVQGGWPGRRAWPAVQAQGHQLQVWAG